MCIRDRLAGVCQPVLVAPGVFAPRVAEVAQKVAKDKYGLDVELVTFNDYVLPNEALSKGDIEDVYKRQADSL